LQTKEKIEKMMMMQ